MCVSLCVCAHVVCWKISKPLPEGIEEQDNFSYILLQDIHALDRTILKFCNCVTEEGIFLVFLKLPHTKYPFIIISSWDLIRRNRKMTDEAKSGG